MGKHADSPALRSPGVDLLDRVLNGPRGDHDERLQPSVIGAAEAIQKAMIGLNEGHLDRGILVLVWSGWDHQVHIDAFLVHVFQTDVRILICSFSGKAGAHELLEVTLCVCPRLRLTQKARRRSAPTFAAMEAEIV